MPIGSSDALGRNTLRPPPPPPYPQGVGASELAIIGYTVPMPGDSIGVVPRDTLATVGQGQDARTLQLMCAASGTPISYGYGRVRVGVKILCPVLATDSQLLVPGFIAAGPIDNIELIECDNAAIQTGIGIMPYDGTQTDPNSYLVAAWQARGATYADVHPGIAYVVLKIPSNPTYRLGNYTATVRLLKVYDPRADSTNGGSGAQRLATPSTWTYSTNPSLCLAHHVAILGGEAMDWASVIAAANANDATLTTNGVSEKARVLAGIFFDTQQESKAIEETLRSYAGVFIDRDGATVRLVIDGPDTPVYAFTNAAPSNYLRDSIQKQRRGRENSPTVVTVRYTDASVTPWATREVTVKATGVDQGAVPYVESVIEWHGCQSAGMATREAIRRLNEFNLADFSLTLTGTDPALRIRRGDVVTVTDSSGLNAKPMRITSCVPRAPGRWSIAMSEYQTGLYDATVYTGPVIPDSGLPSPAAPPVPGTPSAVEEVYQEQAVGGYTSRVRVTWSASSWPFVLQYQLLVKANDGTVIESALVPRGTLEYRTASLQEGKTYTVTLAIVSITGAVGEASGTAVSVLGTKLPPGDVPYLNAVAIGGELLLFWGAAIDIDLTGYEIRVGTTSTSWEPVTDKVYIDRLDALTTRIKGLAAGTWRVFIKARDSIRNAANPYGQYSTNAVYRDVTVEADTGSFLLAEYTYATPTLTNMVAQPREGLPTVYVTDTGETFGSKFTSAVGTYTNVLARYHGGGGSLARLLTEEYDFGADVTGNFSATWDYTNLDGTADPFILLRADGEQAATATAGTSAKGTARYVSVRMDAVLGSATLKVTGLPSVRLDAVARSESSNGTVTSNASGATTVNLANKYARLIDISITVEGTTRRFATYNNVVLSPTATNSFDVYVFDTAGQISAPFRWSITGI